MSITYYKDWGDHESKHAMVALVDFHARLGELGSPLQNKHNLDVILRNVRDGSIQAALIGTGYLFLFDTGVTWHSDKPLLFELLLVRAMEGGTLDEAIADMQTIAKEHACEAVAAGNSLLRPGLRRKFKRAGFHVVGESYFKEV